MRDRRDDTPSAILRARTSTVPMGGANDPRAVVDSRGAVRGLSNIRVVDASIIPDAERRVETARSAYQAGRGSFDTVLLARRGLLDVQLQRLALAVESARAQVRLDYWSASQTLAGVLP